MRKALFILFSFSIVIASAQDTIYTRNGEVIPAKVYEITSTEIKYKKPSNPDGPLYVTSKEDVAVIEYQNGSKDVFHASYNNNGQNPAASQPAYAPRPRVNVVIAPPSIVIGAGWGYYRPWRYHRWHRHGWCW